MKLWDFVYSKDRITRNKQKAMLLGFVKSEMYPKSRHLGWFSLDQPGKPIFAEGMFEYDEPSFTDEYSWANERCMLMTNNSGPRIEAASCADTKYVFYAVCESPKIRVRFTKQ